MIAIRDRQPTRRQAPAAIAALVALACLGLPERAAAQNDPPGSDGGLWSRDTLLGDLGGLRPALASLGATLGLQEISEVLDDASGGIRTGAEYDGVSTMSLSLDGGKAFGLAGATFYVSALQIHGRNLSAERLDDLQTASGIEADRATRLWELWYRQSFLDGAADLKFGQQSIDQEFMGSEGASLYLNTMMGWPMLPSADLYAGGPAYPLSSPGLRIRAAPSPGLTILAGVFDDNPPGGAFASDSPLRGAESSGTRFNLGTGALWIVELQYAADASPAPACGNALCGLPATVKFGAWYDSGAFPDQRFDAAGRSLADPSSNGVAQQHRGNFSLYGVADQEIWRAGSQTLSLFLRAMGAPDDRNLIDFSLNAGINLKAPFAGRDDDTAGIGFDWAHVGARASGLDRDARRFGGAPYPIRGSEAVIEATYQIQIAPWWQLQPDFQYVIDPGGGIPDPALPARRLGDEAVLGLRTTVTF